MNNYLITIKTKELLNDKDKLKICELIGKYIKNKEKNKKKYKQWKLKF